MDIWSLIIYLLNLLFSFFQALIRQPMPGPTMNTTASPLTNNRTVCPPGDISKLYLILIKNFFQNKNYKYV